MNRRMRRLLQVGTGTALGLLLAGLVVWPSLRPMEGNGGDPTPVRPTAIGLDIPLVAADGTSTALGDFRGGWTLLFFGFTTCPDVCPVTLQRIADGLEELEVRGVLAARPITVVMVTVDPEKDTPAALRDYLAPFGSQFVGLTGTQVNLDELASAYGVVVQPPQTDITPTDATNGTGHEDHGATASQSLAHSAPIYVLDPAGRRIGEIPPWPGAKDMADALEAVTQGQAGT